MVSFSVLLTFPIPSYIQTITCPNCSSTMPSSFNFCSVCGTNLHKQIVLKICPRCKKRIPQSSHYCPECGQKQQEE